MSPLFRLRYINNSGVERVTRAMPLTPDPIFKLYKLFWRAMRSPFISKVFYEVKRDGSQKYWCDVTNVFLKG